MSGAVPHFQLVNNTSGCSVLEIILTDKWPKASSDHLWIPRSHTYSRCIGRPSGNNRSAFYEYWYGSSW